MSYANDAYAYNMLEHRVKILCYVTVKLVSPYLMMSSSDTQYEYKT